MSYFKLPLAALAALLLASPLAHAQQTPAATSGKVKTKTKRTQAAATTAAPAPAKAARRRSPILVARSPATPPTTTSKYMMPLP